jgi:D-alanyl-D-alanine dipeptidase
LLNAINPALVGFPELDQSELEFREPVTTSVEAMASGTISDDPTLLTYTTGSEALPSDLTPYLENSATEPHITQPTYDALKNALTLLKTSSEYSGMKLVIASANRSLSTQERLWACYQSKKTTGTCPATGCGKCSQAAVPGSSRHGYGNALDVSWKNTGSGKYVSTSGYANSDWHKSCMVKGKDTASCTADLRASVVALNTMMQSAGFGRICIEWWHHQIGGSSLCSPGQYK